MKDKELGRRKFLGTVAAGATALGVLDLPTVRGGAQSQSTSGDAQALQNVRRNIATNAVVSTYADKRLSPLAAKLDFTGELATTAAERIKVSPDKRFQPMLGFGASFTDAACYMVTRLSDDVRQALMNELLAPAEMNLNVFRICVGSSDYAREAYNYHEKEDVQLRSFSIDYDRAYILPTLREARKINSEAFMFSSPWSPPGWMKTSGTMLGGWMREKYLEPYARYYVRFLEEYAKEGVKVDALTSQNEVETDQRGQMPACFWHPDFEMAFVRDHLAPLLKQRNLNPQIWLNDHNYSQWRRVNYMLADARVKAVTGGVAWHPYVGTPDLVQNTAKLHPDVAFYMTEYGPFLNDGKQYQRYDTEWSKWGAEMTSAIANGCRTYVSWNLALDEEGKPNIGPFKCAGFVTINSKTKDVTRSGHYWAMAHFSRFLKRGAHRIGTESDRSTAPTITAANQTGGQPDTAQFILPQGGVVDKNQLSHIAFTNPSGEHVLVLTNPGARREIVIEIENRFASLSLPDDSVTTVKL